MTTFNGEDFLSEQLESIKKQTRNNWLLWISDDGSSDNTLDIIHKFREQNKDKVFVLSGPRKGSDENFWSLIKNSSIKSEYFAFADQDDIWKEEKLEIAISKISKVKNIPLLYCSRTEIINSAGKKIGLSPNFNKKPSFNNALVQSIAGGNTMVFNKQTRNLLYKVPSNYEIVAHDWLTYQLVTGSGGEVIYDKTPYTKYRQHGKNQIGSNLGLFARVKRISLLLLGRFKNWNEKNILILNHLSHNFTLSSKKDLEYFINLRKNYTFRIKNIFHLKIYRQTRLGNIALIISLLINKI